MNTSTGAGRLNWIKKGGKQNMPIEFVARLELRECDAELEQRYEEYRRAKASLMAYLHNEDIKPSLAPKKETASGN